MNVLLHLVKCLLMLFVVVRLWVIFYLVYVLTFPQGLQKCVLLIKNQI